VAVLSEAYNLPSPQSRNQVSRAVMSLPDTARTTLLFRRLLRILRNTSRCCARPAGPQIAEGTGPTRSNRDAFLAGTRQGLPGAATLRESQA